MVTLFVLLIIGICGGWEIVKSFFAWVSSWGKRKPKQEKNTLSAPAQDNEQQEEKRPDLLDFDEFCDIMDEDDKE